jgi:hypothetical protein
VPVRDSEWVAITYFAYVCALALLLPVHEERPAAAGRAGAAAAALLVLIVAASYATSPAATAVRDWLPTAYILAAYHATGPFYAGPMPRWERWLERIDRRLLPCLFDGRSARAPRALLEAVELIYLSVYALIPAGFAVFYFGTANPPVDRFWTGVLAAELACYALLPWIRTRPPRAIEPAGPRDRRLLFRRLNLAILDRASVRVNTFPSGHSAGAMAVGLALAGVDAPAGAAFTAMAIAIAAASVAGRYHYAADAAAGLAIGALAAAIAARSG